MSYHGSCADAKAAIASVELSENTRSNSGSKILAGSSTPGGAASNKAAHETLQPGRLRAGIKTPKTRTDSLTRKYGAS